MEPLPLWSDNDITSKQKHYLLSRKIYLGDFIREVATDEKCGIHVTYKKCVQIMVSVVSGPRFLPLYDADNSVCT